MRVVTIVQARMGSTRLPGKVLMPLAGKPMLAHVVARAGRATLSDELIVATSRLPADDAIEDFCETNGIGYYRGDEADVLDRYYQAASGARAEAVVRITADCPMIDPEVCDRIILQFLQNQPEVSYCSNAVPRRTYPRGLDTEVFTFESLATAWREDRDPASREHVTTFVYRNPDRFRCLGVTIDPDESAHRWTVDTPEDLELARRIHEYFGHNRFRWQEVLEVINARPDWAALNSHIEQKAV